MNIRLEKSLEEPESVLEGTIQPQHAQFKVFVGGLSPTTTPEDLREYFSKFGLIDDVTVMMERGTGRSRCFAFMTFFEQSVLDKVLLPPLHSLQGRTVEVKKAIPRGEVKPKTRKLFIGGIPPSITPDLLKANFEKYGKVVDAQIMKDRIRGRPRGFGFITFEDDSTLDLVLSKPQHEIGGRLVDVKKAEPKKTSSMMNNLPSPYPVLPTITYFVPYHIMPGPGGENYLTYSPPYQDMYYTSPPPPSHPLQTRSNSFNHGEIEASEESLEQLSIMPIQSSDIPLQVANPNISSLSAPSLMISHSNTTALPYQTIPNLIPNNPQYPHVYLHPFTQYSGQSTNPQNPAAQLPQSQSQVKESPKNQQQSVEIEQKSPSKKHSNMGRQDQTHRKYDKLSGTFVRGGLSQGSPQLILNQQKSPKSELNRTSECKTSSSSNEDHYKSTNVDSSSKNENI